MDKQWIAMNPVWVREQAIAIGLGADEIEIVDLDGGGVSVVPQNEQAARFVEWLRDEEHAMNFPI